MTRLIFAIRSSANAPQKRGGGRNLGNLPKRTGFLQSPGVSWKSTVSLFQSLMGKDTFYNLIRCIKRHFQLH